MTRESGYVVPALNNPSEPRNDTPFEVPDGAGPQTEASAWRERAPALNSFCGEFRDANIELAFQDTVANNRIQQLRIIGVPAAIFFILGTLVDVVVIGMDPVMAGVIVVSRFSVAAVILAAVVMADRKSLSGHALDRLIAVPMVLVSLVTCLIIWAIRGELLLHALTALVLILIFYLFVPVRLAVSLQVSLAFSAGFVAMATLFLNLRPEEFIQVVLYVTLANVLGAFVSRERHTAARHEYATRQAEIEATEELRSEVASRTAAERALGESEARFRSLVELSPDSILVHRQGKILYVNPRGLDLVGSDSIAELSGISVYDFLLPSFREIALERTKKMEERGEPVAAAEFIFRSPNGREIPCEVVSGPIVFEGEPAIQSVVRDITERRRMREELTRLATTDPLTGIYNRRRFFEKLEKEWSRARRHAHPLTVMMFDLDFFKQVNDTHGHAVGDTVLVALVDAAAKLLRGEDVFARLGGEEFAILLPEIALEGTTAVAERMRRHLAEVDVTAPDGPIRCTVSIGVAQGRLAQESPDAALKRADDALYRAKETGRNRVCVA